MVTPAGMTWPVERVKSWRTLRPNEAGDVVSSRDATAECLGPVLEVAWGRTKSKRIISCILAEEAVHLLHVEESGGGESPVHPEGGPDLLAELRDQLRSSGESVEGARDRHGGGVDGGERESQLHLGNVLLGELGRAVQDPLQEIVRLPVVRVLDGT